MTMVLAVDNTKDNTTCSFCGAIKWKNPDLCFVDNQMAVDDKDVVGVTKNKVVCSRCIKEARDLIKEGLI